jgi:flagella basal body P-ring formation protein FlgA
MMLRATTIAALLALSAPTLAQTEIARPTLKASVTLAGELVHIADLVDNAGEAGDVAIFRAPDLGTTGSVLASRVLEAVRPYGLEAIDTTGVTAVVVTRAARDIAAEEIRQRVAEALGGQRGLGAPGDLRLAFDQSLRTLHVETSATAELQVARLAYSSGTQRFDILLYVPGSAVMRHAPLRLTGTVIETAEAVVLSRPLRRGDIIRASDLTTERRPRAEVGDDRIGRIDLATGLAAKHPLRAGHALKQSDLMKPELIHRNEMVTLVYEVPGVLLTMRGKALEAGAEGDAVSVLNLESKRTVQGTVTELGRVAVIHALARNGLARTASAQPVGNPTSNPSQ